MTHSCHFLTQIKFEKSYKAVRERRLKRWDDLLKFYRMTPEDKTPKIKRFMRKGTAEIKKNSIPDGDSRSIRREPSFFNHSKCEFLKLKIVIIF